MPSVKPLIYENAVIYVGDPTQTDGAGMIVAGETRGEVTTTVNEEVFHAMLDRTGAIPIAGTGYDTGSAPTASIPLIGYGLEALDQLITSAQIYEETAGTPTEVLALGSTPRKVDVADYFTLAIVPVSDAQKSNNGVDSKNACWFPRCLATSGAGQFTWDRPTSDDYLNGRDVTFEAAYASKDQADTTIPTELRRGFIGPVSDVTSLTWSLPPFDASV